MWMTPASSASASPMEQSSAILSLMNVGYTGTLGSWMGLDPTDAPLMLRDRGTNDIYALTPAEQ